MFCKQCGASLPDATVFCPKCGAQQVPGANPAPNPAANPAPDSAAPIPTGPAMAPAPKKKKRGLVVAIVLILVLIGAGIGAYFLWFSGDGDSDSDDEKSGKAGFSSGEEAVVETLEAIFVEKDAEKLINDCLPDLAVEQMMEEENVASRSELVDLAQDKLDNYFDSDNMPNMPYGIEDYEITGFEITDSEELSPDEVAALSDEKECEIEEAILYDVDMVLSMSMDGDTSEGLPISGDAEFSGPLGQATAGKIDGRWYIVDIDSD